MKLRVVENGGTQKIEAATTKQQIKEWDKKSHFFYEWPSGLLCVVWNCVYNVIFDPRGRPQSRPVVITIFTQIIRRYIRPFVRPSIRSKTSKSRNNHCRPCLFFRPSGSLMTPVIFFFNFSPLFIHFLWHYKPVSWLSFCFCFPWFFVGIFRSWQIT